jgi:hypothetical protein
MAKKAPAKKTAAKRATTGTTTGVGKNVATLTKAGVIPANYALFSPAEKMALESLSATEVAAIISTKTKMGPKFFPKHATHGMYY